MSESFCLREVILTCYSAVISLLMLSFDPRNIRVSARRSYVSLIKVNYIQGQREGQEQRNAFLVLERHLQADASRCLHGRPWVPLEVTRCCLCSAERSRSRGCWVCPRAPFSARAGGAFPRQSITILVSALPRCLPPGTLCHPPSSDREPGPRLLAQCWLLGSGQPGPWWSGCCWQKGYRTG